MAKEAGVLMRISPIAPMLLDPRAVQAPLPDELDFTSKETRVAVLDMVLLHTCPQSQLLFNRIRRRPSLPLLRVWRRVEWETAILLVVCAPMKKMVTHRGGGRKGRWLTTAVCFDSLADE